MEKNIKNCIFAEIILNSKERQNYLIYLDKKNKLAKKMSNETIQYEVILCREFLQNYLNCNCSKLICNDPYFKNLFKRLDGFDLNKIPFIFYTALVEHLIENYEYKELVFKEFKEFIDHCKKYNLSICYKNFEKYFEFSDCTHINEIKFNFFLLTNRIFRVFRRYCYNSLKIVYNYLKRRLV